MTSNMHVVATLVQHCLRSAKYSYSNSGMGEGDLIYCIDECLATMFTNVPGILMLKKS